MPDPTPADPAQKQDPKPADPNAPDPTAGDPPNDPLKTDPPDDGDVDLGDAGKKALQREREARKAAEKAKAEADAKIKEYEDAQLSERERLEKERDEAKKAAATTAQEAALYKAAVTYGLTEDDLELLEGVPADQVDSRAKRLSERLAESKAEQNGSRTPRPDPSQGSRGPVDLDAQIAEAEQKGDVRASIRLKQEKALAARTAATK